MLPAQFASRFCLTLAALAGLASGVRGGFQVISQPNAPYLASTTPVSVPGSGPSVQSLAAGNLTITFSAPMDPVSPASLYSQQQLSRTLTFSEPLETFGLEMRPDNTLISFLTAPMTAQFFHQTTLLGTINLSGTQHSPRLFAATDTDTPFTSVQLSTVYSVLTFRTYGFVISDVRTEVATPEPASLVVFGMGLFGVFGYGWRQRAGSRDSHR
jgi:hypothetical protein